MSFPRYPRYKDSGVEWLGEVPEHECQRANGPIQSQPRATPWVHVHAMRRALKGRSNHWTAIGSPFQGSSIRRPPTQGVALGWHGAGRWPLRGDDATIGDKS